MGYGLLSTLRMGKAQPYQPSNGSHGQQFRVVLLVCHLLYSIHIVVFTLEECHFRQSPGILSENHPKGFPNDSEVSRLEQHLPTLSGPARGGSGIPIYPIFSPQDTNIP